MTFCVSGCLTTFPENWVGSVWLTEATLIVGLDGLACSAAVTGIGAELTSSAAPRAPAPWLTATAPSTTAHTPRERDVDVDRLDPTAASLLSIDHVLFSPEIREFLRQAIEAGANGQLLVQALPELTSAKSLGKAFARLGVEVSSLTEPDIQYNKSTLEVAIRTGWSFHAPVISSGANLDKFIDDCLAAGLTASQCVGWAQTGVFEGADRFRRFPDAVKKKLPRLQFDVAMIVAEWKTRYAAEWTPAIETYLTEALRKSFENGEFHVSRVRSFPGGPDRVRGGLPELRDLLGRYSKLTPPVEVKPSP